MDKKIYILVPAYNVQKYIRACIESVINQTYKNWKMIIVDDGSTDSTGKICDEYAEKYSNIKIIHQKNQGLFCARIAAVNYLREHDDTEDSYCMFFDSDDILPYTTLEVHKNTIEKYDCDLVCGNSLKFVELNKPKQSTDNTEIKNPRVYENEEVLDKLYPCCFGYDVFSVSLCFKIYRTPLITESFAEIDEHPKYFGEDLNATIRILPKAKKVVVIDNIVYFHRTGGGTNRFMKSYIDDCLLLYSQKNKFAKIYNVDPYLFQLIDVEMKNMAVNYLIMCVRTKTYPHGNFNDEMKYICEEPVFRGAVENIKPDTLGRDGSEIPGFVESYLKKDYATLGNIIKKKASENKLRRFIKKLL